MAIKTVFFSITILQKAIFSLIKFILAEHGRTAPGNNFIVNLE
jgi:hypothetical protein